MEEFDDRTLALAKELSEKQMEVETDYIKEEKKLKPIQTVIDMGFFAAILFLSIAAIITFVFLGYFFFTGVKFDTIFWIVIICFGLFFMATLVLFFMILRAGKWWKIGWDLARKKGELNILFAKGHRILFEVVPKKPMMDFRKGDKRSRFLPIKKGYVEPSTGAVARTVMENAITDFDANEEYKNDLEELSPMFNSRLEQEFDAGNIWNKENKEKLMMLVIAALCVSLLTAGISIGGFYYTMDAISKSKASTDSNIMAMKTDISQKLAELQTNQGNSNVIVK